MPYRYNKVLQTIKIKMEYVYSNFCGIDTEYSENKVDQEDLIANNLLYD